MRKELLSANAVCLILALNLHSSYSLHVADFEDDTDIAGEHMKLGEVFYDAVCRANKSTVQIGKTGTILYSGTDYYDDYYRDNLDCIITLMTTPDRRILLTWIHFDVESLDDTVVVGTCQDKLKVFDGPSTKSKLFNADKQCGFAMDMEYPSMATTGNSVTFHMLSDDHGEKYGYDFEVILTSFSEGPCTKDEFQCNNGRCISKSLVGSLDPHDNCGDGSDRNRSNDELR